MNVVTYPSDLPSVREGFQITIRPDSQVNNFYSNNTRSYRNYSLTSATVNVQWFLKQSQYIRFHEFYVNDLENGSLAFEINLNFPQKVKVKFASNFEITNHYANNLYVISAVLLMLDSQI